MWPSITYLPVMVEDGRGTPPRIGVDYLLTLQVFLVNIEVTLTFVPLANGEEFHLRSASGKDASARSSYIASDLVQTRYMYFSR